MDITLQTLRDALKGQRRSEEVVFWFCYAWHRGRDSTLYKILRECTFTPRRHAQAQIADDPEIAYGLRVLGDLVTRATGLQLGESKLRRVKFDEVREDDVLVHGNVGPDHTVVAAFPCIDKGWPCRVYLHHGALGVACAEGPNGASFHPLKPDEHGLVIGFLR